MDIWTRQERARLVLMLAQHDAESPDVLARKITEGYVPSRHLIAARDALHRLCLERRSTDGYTAVFAEINAALFPDPSTQRGAVDRVGISARKAMADAIKDDPADGDWVVWITPTDAADAALRGLEAAGLEVRPSTTQGVVSAERDAAG